MAEETPTDEVGSVDVLRISDISDQLRALSDQLTATSAHSARDKFRDLEKLVEFRGDQEDVELLDEAHDTAVRQTLMGLAQFRRSYEYWERLIAEYALKSGLSQRQAAGYLGVAVSTINRWAQHPLNSESRND